MNKILVLVLIAVFSALLVGCGAEGDSSDSIEAGNAETANGDVDNDDGEMSAKMDTNDNGVADIEVVQAAEDLTEVTIDFDDVQDEETKEAMAAAVGNPDYCVPGSTYTYESEEGSVDSIVIGLTTYKGSEFCEAESVSVISTPVGDINSATTYYFDNTYKEYWVIVTTSGGPAPATTTEVHIIDGEVQ